MAVVLFLFFIGPTTDEALFLITTIYKVCSNSGGKGAIEVGVFKEHLYPIGFGAVSMIVKMIYTIHQSFKPIFVEAKISTNEF